jgi:hypothetical protein
LLPEPVTSRAPIDSVACVSVAGVQCWPPSVDFHTPPSAAPANSVPSGAAASAVIRPDTQRSPAPELLKPLVGSMYCGESEKSLPSVPGRPVRSVHAPPTVGSAAACAAPAAYAFGSTAPFGASRCAMNQSVASATSWLSSPASLFGGSLAANPGAAAKAIAAIKAENRANRRILINLSTGEG